MSLPNTRHQSRELALQLLFQLEFTEISDARSAYSRFMTNFRPPHEVAVYAEKLVFGVIESLGEIDGAIQKHSPHWKVARMDKVDRNTLRIGAFELMRLHHEVPPKVAINEAVELGKVYGNAESAAFINGLLDALARSQGLIAS